jgi:hypothetical protein
MEQGILTLRLARSVRDNFKQSCTDVFATQHLDGMGASSPRL